MAEDTRSSWGDVFSTGRSRTVNGQPYDASNPRHRAALEMPGGDEEDTREVRRPAWRARRREDDGDSVVESVTADAPLTHGEAGEVVVNEVPGVRQVVRGGRGSEVTPGNMTIVRRRS